MNIRHLSSIAIAVAFTVAAVAQDSGSAPPAGPNGGQNATSGSGGHGQHGGHGGMGGGAGMMMGRGLMGTVTEVAADHYTIKTGTGDVYTVHFTADTRIFKQVAGGMRGPGEGAGAGGGQGQGGGRGYGGGNPPQEIKSTDIKAGDAVAVMGNIDATTKSAAATRIAQLDPAVVQQIRAMEADFGKTWLMGKVTAINETKVTLMGSVDNAVHSFVADENTTFRKRREPITLGDVAVGDGVRVEGAVKDGVFLATSVAVMGQPAGAGQGPQPAPQPK